MVYDKKQLAKLVLKAKGENRSIRQYAEDANISPSIISRILSESYKPGIKVLQRLTSEAAKPQGNVSLKDLTIAAGYSADVVGATAAVASGALLSTMPLLGPIGGIVSGMVAGAFTSASKNAKDRKALDEEDCNAILLQLEKKQRHFKTISWGLIRDLMTEIGCNWAPGALQDLVEENKPDDYVLIKNNRIKEWWFTFWGKDSALDKLNIMSKEDRLTLLVGRFILTPVNDERKISIVTDDTELYEYASSLQGKTSYNGNLSIMLVDLDEIQVVAECNIAKKKETISLIEEEDYNENNR